MHIVSLSKDYMRCLYSTSWRIKPCGRRRRGLTGEWRLSNSCRPRDTRTYFLLYFKKIIRRAILTHIRERIYAFDHHFILQSRDQPANRPNIEISNRQFHVLSFPLSSFSDCPAPIKLLHYSISNVNPPLASVTCSLCP